MTELFTDTVLNMMTTTAEPEDYTGEDGLLYCGNYVAFIFNGTNGNGKYRIDIYNMNGTQVLSLPFAIEYRDALISDQELIIYNEAECLIYNLNGKEKYSGPIPEQTQLLKTLGGNRFLAVTVNSIDMIEMK